MKPDNCINLSQTNQFDVDGFLFTIERGEIQDKLSIKHKLSGDIITLAVVSNKYLQEIQSENQRLKNKIVELTLKG
jgi:hypothetical protein